MKNLILGTLALILISCSGDSKLDKLSEVELDKEMSAIQNKFDVIFNNHYEEDSLKVLNDSLVIYIGVLAENFPKSKKLPSWYFVVGETNMKIKQGQAAIKYFETLEINFPQHEDVPKAIYFKAYTYENVLQDIERAIETYKTLYKTYPDSRWAENAKSQVLFLNNPSFIGE